MTTETKQYIRARIIADDSPESPREWSNLGTFVGFEHRSYTIGDRRPTDAEIKAAEYGGFDALEKHLRRQYGATVILRVGMLDHSGVSFYVGGGAHWSDSQGWDSGTCGYIFDTAESRAECGTAPEHIEAALRGEIETYNQWASGDVYGYIIERRTLCDLCATLDQDEIPTECPHCEIDDSDSCWGFYGTDLDEWDVPEDARDALQAEADAGHVEYPYGGRRVEAEWRAV